MVSLVGGLVSRLVGGWLVNGLNVCKELNFSGIILNK